MQPAMIPFLALGFGSVFVASVSQVLLKKAALRPARDLLHEYLNARVIAAYALFFGSTLLTVYAYRGVPLSMGPMFEATSYVYVTLFGALFFMHSFLQAMRELPEEGNIEALKERMIRVLVYEQHEKFSVDVGLFVGPPPTQEQESFAQEIYETLMSSMRNPGAKS